MPDPRASVCSMVQLSKVAAVFESVIQATPPVTCAKQRQPRLPHAARHFPYHAATTTTTHMVGTFAHSSSRVCPRLSSCCGCDSPS